MADRREELATIFDAMADMLDILGENYHRIMAYRRAAENLRALGEPLEKLAQEARLQTIAGIGETLATKIEEYLHTGRLEAYEKLRDQVPSGVLEFLKVPGIGPRKAAFFWRELGLTSLDELEGAARAGQLHGLKGFGHKTETNILEGIVALRRRQDQRLPLGVAAPLAQEIITALQTVPGVLQISPAGSLRRMRETVGDLDILVAAYDSEPVMARFRTLPMVADVLLTGATKTSIRTADGFQIDLRVLAPERWGAALQYFTGSQAHNIQLRALAQAQGLSLSEYGFRRADDSELICATEEAVYATLGLPWIPPELREDRGEIEAAQAGRLPALVQRENLLGDFQCHTTRSDGHSTLEGMARAAQAAGLHYIVVSDHTAGLGIAHGMEAEAVDELLAEVARVNATLGDSFRVLAGAEVEIRADGSLDWPEEALVKLDFVVAAVHSGLSQPREQATARLLAAIRHPWVDLIAHPTGRLLGRREAMDLDMEALFQAARESGVALEINAHPNRLDLNDVYLRRAAEAGVMLAISSDAHDGEGFAVLPYGVAMARRGWLEPHQLLNTRPAEAVLAWKRQRHS